MRLLAVSHEASRTGAVRAFVDALPALRSMSTELTVISKVRGPLVDEMSSGTQRVIVEPRNRTAQLRRLARLKYLGWVPPLVERRVALTVLHDLSPDMVYASTVLSSEYIAAAQKLSIACVLHVHEQQPLTSWALRRAGVRPVGLSVIAPSSFVAKELELLGSRVVAVLPGPVHVSDVPIALEEPSPWSAMAHKILVCGSVAPGKGSELVLDLAELLPSLDGRVVEWVWLGAGDTRRAALNAAHRGLAQRVRFIGERSKVRPFMAYADVLVMPSSQETLGLVALEAAATATPTVAFSVGGLPDVLRDSRALAPPGDTRALIQKVVDVLRDDRLRRALLDASSAVLAEAELTTWRGKIAAVVEAVFSGALPGGQEHGVGDLRRSQTTSPSHCASAPPP
jgi:glycosyltransferase involved in cell wall biosynthesis